MLIEESLLREDFKNIYEKTMQEYYKIVFGKEVKVEIVKPSIRNRIVMYPKVGIVVTRDPCKQIIYKQYKNWLVRDNFFRRALAETYVMTCMFTFGLLASKSIELSDYSVMNNSIMIEPGNRKIRIYDFEHNYVDSIIKKTFTKKYFNNELKFRLNSNYDFIPKIHAHGDNWYREECLPGWNLIRVKNQNLFNKAINDIVGYLKLMTEKTLHYMDVEKYVADKYDYIIEKVAEANVVKHIDCYDKICRLAEIASNYAKKLNAPLPVAESHGDLQLGNLWLDRKHEKAYIIDWETHEIRSIWYDCATMLLTTRRANGLRKMMQHRDKIKVKESILKIDPYKEYNMLAVIGILTLEDIVFYLDDMLELPGDIGGEIFNWFAGEVESMGWDSLDN